MNILLVWSEIPDVRFYYLQDVSKGVYTMLLRCNGKIVHRDPYWPEASWIIGFLARRRPVTPPLDMKKVKVIYSGVLP